MDTLSYDLKAQLHSIYFPRLEELLLAYHNDESKITVGNRLALSANGKRLKSLCLGIRGPLFLSARKDTSLNPHLTKHTQTKEGNDIYKLIFTIIGMVFPSFVFNSVIINYDSNFLMHKDDRNMSSHSVMFTIGEHEGGGLCIFDDNEELIDTLYIDHHPIKFPGKTTYHSTEPFIGTRYCIVAYETRPRLVYDPYEKEIYPI